MPLNSCHWPMPLDRFAGMHRWTVALAYAAALCRRSGPAQCESVRSVTGALAYRAGSARGFGGAKAGEPGGEWAEERHVTSYRDGAVQRVALAVDQLGACLAR